MAVTPADSAFAPGARADATAFPGGRRAYTTAVGSTLIVGVRCRSEATCPPDRPASVWLRTAGSTRWLLVMHTKARALDPALNDGRTSPVRLNTATPVVREVRVVTPEWKNLAGHEEEFIVAIAPRTAMSVRLLDGSPSHTGIAGGAVLVASSPSFVIRVRVRPAGSRAVRVTYVPAGASPERRVVTTNSDGIARVTLSDPRLRADRPGQLYVTVLGTSARAGARGGFVVRTTG